MLMKRFSFLLLLLMAITLAVPNPLEAQRRSSRSNTDDTQVVEGSETEESTDEESKEQSETVKWAEIEVSGLLPEGPSLPGLFGEIGLSLDQLFERLDRAVEDDDVNAIVLRLNNPVIGLGTVNELQHKIKSIREQGKPVIAMLETAMTTDYLVAAACDKIYMPEPGMLLMTGLRAEVMFYKNLLEMLDVEADILRVGKYKAAAEPYTRTDMSPEFRDEISTLLDGQFEIIVSTIAESRGLSKEEVNRAIDNGPHTAQSALDEKLIDGIYYEDEFEELALQDKANAEFELVEKYGKKKVDMNFEGFTGMMKMMNLLMGVEPRKKKSDTPQIAIIYATGTIMSGKGSSGPFGEQIVGSETIIDAIEKAATNERVEAIVLRVNSPGGSAIASDLMWRELQSVDKPIVVSMGDVAASGGYYISMGADHIFAEPGTVTGSIGVVGGKLAFEGLFEKLGITTSYVTKGENSGALSAMQPFSESERKAMQKVMNQIYELFVEKAAEGRDMTVEKVKELGGGRIYIGQAAVENGLVDSLGTLDDAVDKAKELAGINADQEVDRLKLPKPTSPFEQLFGPVDAQSKLNVGGKTNLLEGVLPGEVTAQLRNAFLINELSKNDPRLLLMPFSLKFK